MTVVFPLSDSVNDLLAIKERPSTGRQSAETIQAFATMIRRGEVLWKYENTHRMVVKCGPTVIGKIAGTEDHAEFANLQYLEGHCPEIPAPRPLGLVTLGLTFYTFMSFIPGITIREAWKDMQQDQKMSFRDHFNELLLKLRSLPLPADAVLGAVSGKGCKDTRRQTRVSKGPIKDSAEFEDFQFSNPHFGGSVYIELLRRFSPRHPQNIVFSHGDLNAGNIMLQLGESGQYQITGLIDWDRGGFYPEFFECTKATSLMSALENDDWFLFLLPCISPQQYPILWLRDRLWDSHVV
jgi:aminoglycoside phosphotransferase (APT) family kinase protein